MAAPAQLEDNILRNAVRLRLQRKPAAYALHSESETLVYTKGEARGAINTKLREREVKCLTDEGVPPAVATQFVADKAADLQARLHANEASPDVNASDDVESLPEMSG